MLTSLLRKGFTIEPILTLTSTGSRIVAAVDISPEKTMRLI